MMAKAIYLTLWMCATAETGHTPDCEVVVMHEYLKPSMADNQQDCQHAMLHGNNKLDAAADQRTTQGTVYLRCMTHAELEKLTF